MGQKRSEVIVATVQRVILNLYHVACEPLNYAILTSLPLTVIQVRGRFPVGDEIIIGRLNHLVQVGLARIDNSTSTIHQTDFTAALIRSLHELHQNVLYCLPHLTPAQETMISRRM